MGLPNRGGLTAHGANKLSHYLSKKVYASSKADLEDLIDGDPMIANVIHHVVTGEDLLPPSIAGQVPPPESRLSRRERRRLARGKVEDIVLEEDGSGEKDSDEKEAEGHASEAAEDTKMDEEEDGGVMLPTTLPIRSRQ